jgi:FtsP/CotA-like multicopper oxidase with cupredoxin domain
MYLPEKASRVRQIEAQKARDNRSEIVRALNQGQVTKRELIKWGIFTVTGALALKNGLSPYAQSAFGAVPTGTPRSPLWGATKFSQAFKRLNLQAPTTLVEDGTDHLTNYSPNYLFNGLPNEKHCKKTSYHTDHVGDRLNREYLNLRSGRGPCEGRPDGVYFEHQRWNTFKPKVGYVLSMGQADQVGTGLRHHPLMMKQKPNSVWSYGSGATAAGTLPAPLIKARYGESVITRIYNNLPLERSENEGFGRNEISNHFHNAHNGAESDGACNAFHFPGTFYDYHWSTTLARHDKINTAATERRASGPDNGDGLNLVQGDFRELQGTMWFHDHRFFFTAENVYKGMAGKVNYYSGPDRGRDNLNDGVNLRLPSGNQLPWGNIDFDVNLMISDAATDPNGQLFFDIFNTDGFLGDMLMVNHQYAPYMNVVRRKYRFRLLNACMSRFIQLAIASPYGTPSPIQFIANDGNLVVSPISLFGLDQQGVAERYDIVIDFARYSVGQTLHLVNLLQQTDGRMPNGAVSLGAAMAGDPVDPAVGPIMQFRIVDSVLSVDNPLKTWYSSDRDESVVPPRLTEQIPLVAPVRTRTVEFARSSGDSRDPTTGQCTPDCAPGMPFPWVIKINGQSAHSMNANRISLLIPKPGEVEHWTYINGGAGWDHPIHLHFEEGITMNRGTGLIPATEKNVRKDVWRLRPGGRVQFQVQFGEFGGSYVNHCHNTVHEDFAMLLRYQLLANNPDGIMGVTKTPNPTPNGVVWTDPEILPEGDPRTPV